MINPIDINGLKWNFHCERDAAGRIYVRAYRNVWDPKAKQSRTAKRFNVGRLLDDNSVRLSKSFCELFPQYADIDLYYASNELMTFEEFEAQYQPSENSSDISWSDDTISYGVSWCAWQFAKKEGLLDDLKKIFGQQLGTKLLNWAIYQLDTGGAALMNYEDWLAQNWLDSAQPDDARRISEWLSEVKDAQIEDFYRLRHQRALHQSGKNPMITLSIDSTSISTYSNTIQQAAYGHAKQDPELKQVNLCLVCSHETGDVLFACTYEGSINDRAYFTYVLEKMINAGFDLNNNILVTDRGYQSIYNAQLALKLNLKFIQGISINEDCVKQQFRKNATILNNSITCKDPKTGCSMYSAQETWSFASEAGSQTTKLSLHMYKNQIRGIREAELLLDSVNEVWEQKCEGKNVDSERWRKYGRFIKQVRTKNGYTWEIDREQLLLATEFFGCFAIRTNAVSNPMQAREIYRQRNVIEMGFDQLKNEVGGKRMHGTEMTYRGRLFLFQLAQALRMIMRRTAVKVSANDANLEIPANSMRKLLIQLGGLKARKHRSTQAFVVEALPKKKRDLLALLDLPQPPKTLYRFRN